MQPVNNPYIYTDNNVSITSAEITQTLTRGKTLLADMAISAGYEKLYLLEKSNPCPRTLLYLYLYALEQWVNTDGAENFMTLQQLKKLLSAIEQLFCDCVVNGQQC